MSAAVSVLILDEPQDLSATVRATLEHMPEFHTIGEADLAADDGNPLVALVSIDEVRLADGVALIAGLKERRPDLRTLVAFGALTAEDTHALLAAGADAFVARTASPRDLGATLLALAAGSNRLGSMAPDLGAEAGGGEGTGDGLGLTPREAEVLRFLSSGFSNKEVARRLTLSVRTVETHRLNLRRKTQTGRLKDLVTLARQLGLAPVVDPEPLHRSGEGAPRVIAGRHARH